MGTDIDTLETSLFAGARTTAPLSTLPLEQVLRTIRDGTYASDIDTLRLVLRDKGQDAYRQAKVALDAFTPAGTFAHRSTSGLVALSGIIHGDIDHLPDVESARCAINADASTLYCFTSPSGAGLKVGLRVKGLRDAQDYARAWRAGAAYHLDAHGLSWDQSGKDVSRLCFVSHDPHCYFNPHAVPFAPPPPAVTPQTPSPSRSVPIAAQPDDAERCREALRWIPADDYDTWLRIGMALHDTGNPWARDVWDQWSATSPKYAPDVQEQKWRSFKGQGVTLGSLFALAQSAGWREERASLQVGNNIVDRLVQTHKERESIDWENIPLPTPLDAVRILNTPYPLPQWIIKGLIPEGLTFFAGSPKSSKTYLAYSLALSLALQSARDEKWLGYYDVKMPGPVVYITLEDDPADTKQRILELYPQGLPQLQEGRLIFYHGIDVPPLGQGLCDWITAYILPAYNPALIVLDPISYLYPNTKKTGDQFPEVREMLLPLRTLGREHHIGIIGVDHRRKKSNEDVDVFETIYGSNAKIAIADSLLMIVRDNKEVTIHARVRRGADQTLSLNFEFDESGAAHWDWKGASDGLISQGTYGDLRQQVTGILSLNPRPWPIADLLSELDMPDTKATRNSLYQILYRMQKSNEVQKTTRGLYVWAASDV